MIRKKSVVKVLLLLTVSLITNACGKSENASMPSPVPSPKSALIGSTWVEINPTSELRRTFTIRETELDLKIDCLFPNGNTIYAPSSFTVALNAVEVNKVYFNGNQNLTFTTGTGSNSCGWHITSEILIFSSTSGTATLTTSGRETLGTFQKQ